MSFKLMMGGLLAAAATAAIAQPAPPAPAPMAGQGWSRPAPRPETRAEVVTRTQAMFARLDRNRDGVITQDEIAPMGGAAGEAGAPPPLPGGPNAMAGMFDRMDLNHDGVITRDEFNQAHARMGAMHDMGGIPGMPGEPGEQGARIGRGMGAGRMLMMADANRDGRITLQEMTAAALQRFDRMDLNHDGTVTPDERTQARAQRGAHSNR